MSFVLDASMALAWYFRDELTALSRAVSAMSDEQGVVVPGHWLVEVGNGMLVGERKGRAGPDDTVRFAERLNLLDIEVDATGAGEVVHRILPLARAHGLTVYDTLYLELAERRGLPLASLDGQLNAAAKRVGIPLIERLA